VSSATARPLAPSRSVSLYVLVELLAGPEVVLLNTRSGSKQPSGLRGSFGGRRGALQRELANGRPGFDLKNVRDKYPPLLKSFVS